MKENGKLVAKDVSEDHKPDTPAEKARIQSAGGRVFAVRYDDGIDGPARVWLAHADIPGLAMSRSLGDKVAHTAGVSSEPEIFEVNAHSSYSTLLIHIHSHSSLSRSLCSSLFTFSISHLCFETVHLYCCNPTLSTLLLSTP